MDLTYELDKSVSSARNALLRPIRELELPHSSWLAILRSSNEKDPSVENMVKQYNTIVVYGKILKLTRATTAITEYINSNLHL